MQSKPATATGRPRQEPTSGIELLDRAHGQILEQVDALLAALKDQPTAETVRALVAVLERYVTEHFAQEEELMRATHYPEAYRHFGGHGQLKTYLAGIREEMRLEVPDTDRVTTTTQLLAAAVVDHVDTFDRELADYLRDRGAGG